MKSDYKTSYFTLTAISALILSSTPLHSQTTPGDSNASSDSSCNSIINTLRGPDHSMYRGLSQLERRFNLPLTTSISRLSSSESASGRFLGCAIRLVVAQAEGQRNAIEGPEAIARGSRTINNNRDAARIEIVLNNLEVSNLEQKVADSLTVVTQELSARRFLIGALHRSSAPSNTIPNVLGAASSLHTQNMGQSQRFGFGTMAGGGGASTFKSVWVQLPSPISRTNGEDRSIGSREWLRTMVQLDMPERGGPIGNNPLVFRLVTDIFSISRRYVSDSNVNNTTGVVAHIGTVRPQFRTAANNPSSARLDFDVARVGYEGQLEIGEDLALVASFSYHMGLRLVEASSLSTGLTMGAQGSIGVMIANRLLINAGASYELVDSNVNYSTTNLFAGLSFRFVDGGDLRLGVARLNHQSHGGTPQPEEGNDPMQAVPTGFNVNGGLNLRF